VYWHAFPSDPPPIQRRGCVGVSKYRRACLGTYAFATNACTCKCSLQCVCVCRLCPMRVYRGSLQCVCVSRLCTRPTSPKMELAIHATSASLACVHWFVLPDLALPLPAMHQPRNQFKYRHQAQNRFPLQLPPPLSKAPFRPRTFISFPSAHLHFERNGAPPFDEYNLTPEVETRCLGLQQNKINQPKSIHFEN